MKMLLSFLLSFLMALFGYSGGMGGQGTVDPAGHIHDVGTSTGVVFQPWDGSAITAPGTYNLYLEDDLSTGAQLVLGDLKSERDITINLCLNGMDWSSDARAAIIGDGVTLNICNCQETESTITGKGDTFATRGGTFQVNPFGELNIYENVNVTCDNSQGRILYAGVVDLKGSMGIYGGTVTGCEVKREAMSDGSADLTTGQGGAISVAGGGTLYMKDGLITGGTACTGANVRLETGASFIMEGGKITGGYSKYFYFRNASSGGNGAGVFVEGAAFVMMGGVISDNQCDGKGAGVILNGCRGSFVIHGDAQIINNKSYHAEYSGGLHINNASSSLTVHGTPTVKNNTNASGVSNMYTVGSHAPIGGQGSTGNQGSTGSQGAGGSGGTHVHDIGGTRNADFKPWDGMAITKSGTYNLYLQSDLHTRNQLVFGDLTDTRNITVNLCLNGKKWTSDARAAFIGNGVTLNICNCQASECTVVGKGDYNVSRGGTFQVDFDGALNVYSNVNITCDNSQNRVKYAGVIDLRGRMGIYGATITGCKVDRIAKANGMADLTTGQGGAIAVAGGAELYMKDGLITGGTACTGANVRLETGANFVMDGGKITNGYSKFYYFNGQPSGGNGAGVFVEQAAFYMKGGEISGNRSDGKAAVICNGKGCVVELSGDAKIINNVSTHAEFGGGMHYANADGVLKLSGRVQITGNKNASGASNVLIYAPGMVINAGSGLSPDARVGISVRGNAEGKVVDRNVAGVFSSDNAGCELVTVNGGLFLSGK